MVRMASRWACAPAVALMLVLAGCSGSRASLPTSGPTLRGTLNGSGATFPKLFYQSAIQVYGLVQPDLTVNYNPTGSGAGQTDLQNNLVNFAGTDGLVKDSDRAKFQGGAFLYFPTVAAPIAVSYNVAGLAQLQLAPDTLAKIFGRQVKTWNDPAIAADNPGVNLPATPIVVVHRSDGSGTTENFTKYLGQAAPSTWTLGSGKTVAWATDTVGAEGSGGVAKAVQFQNGAIAYVDFGDGLAAKLAMASVKNASGSYVAPTLAGASAALAGVEINPDLTYDPLNASGADAYPITAPTWILVYRQQSNQATLDNLKGFLRFLLTTGQEGAASVNFAKLSPELTARALAQLDELQVKA